MGKLTLSEALGKIDKLTVELSSLTIKQGKLEEDNESLALNSKIKVDEITELRKQLVTSNNTINKLKQNSKGLGDEVKLLKDQNKALRGTGGCTDGDNTLKGIKLVAGGWKFEDRVFATIEEAVAHKSKRG